MSIPCKSKSEIQEIEFMRPEGLDVYIAQSSFS